MESVVPNKVSMAPDELNSQSAGLNRRARRRIARSKRVLVHLFSGVQSWKGQDGDYILEIEREKGRDVLNNTLFSFLLQLILDSIIGGPPCTTFSRARTRSPGPRVLRSREGAERFGLVGLNPRERVQLDRDNALILRMLLLVHVAQEVSEDSCFIAIEHPRDPDMMELRRSHAPLPSLWCWPELGSLNLLRAEVDQGRLGHSHVKPTTIATNSWGLYERLHNLVVKPEDRWVVGEQTCSSLEQRIANTRKAAEWAPGLSEAILRSWKEWVSEESSGLGLGVKRLRQLSDALKAEGQSSAALDRVCQAFQDRARSRLSKLSPAELSFRKHVECGHVPWRADCRTCVHSAAHRSPCRRRKHPHMYTLCLDLAGPFKPGLDYAGSAKYALVGVYTYPRFWKGGEPVPDKAVGGPKFPNPGESELPKTTHLPPHGRDTKRGHPTDLPPHGRDTKRGHPTDLPPHERDTKQGHPDFGDISHSHQVGDGASGPHHGDIDIDLLEPPVPESLHAAVADPLDHPIPEDFVLEEESPLEEGVEPPLDPKELDFTKTCERKWKIITKANLEPLQALHFPMVVPVYHKGKRSVLRAIQQMYVLLKKQGFPLFRVHTDRGREFINNELKSYLLARDICHTSTPADLPASNGLVERYIGIIKSQARTMLYQSQLGENHWPSAMRYVAARKFAESLSYLGAKPVKFLPFGSTIVVQARSWKHKTWLPRGVNAQLLFPAPEVSKGWLVLVKKKDGSPSFMCTTLCYSNLKDPQPLEVEQSQPEQGVELQSPKSKADGTSPDIPILSPPLPAEASRRRIVGKQGLRETQGGVSLGVSGLGESGDDRDMRRVYFAEKLATTPVSGHGQPSDDEKEIRAKELLKGEGLIDRAQLRDLLQGCTWPRPKTSRKLHQRVAGSMVAFGAFTHGGCHGVLRATFQRPALVSLLNRYVQQVAPLARYTALAISEGVQLEWHRDKHNLFSSVNWVVPIGEFEGGDIRVLLEGQSQDEADMSEHRGLKLEASKGPVSFNPRRRHCVLPFTGHRLVLIGYTPRGFAKLTTADLRTLEELRFPVPTPDSLELRALIPEAEAYSTDEEVWDERGGISSKSESEDGTEEPISHLGALQAFYLAEQDYEELCANAMFLSRAVRQERNDILEELKVSSVRSLESVQGLRVLEKMLHRVEQELELSDAVKGFENSVDQARDLEWVYRAKLAQFRIVPETGSDVRMDKLWLSSLHESSLGPQSSGSGESSATQGSGTGELVASNEVEIWYQTQTVDPQVAASEIEKWVPALTEEYVGLTTQYRAITPIKKSDLPQEDINSGAIEVLPAKVVYTRKPPQGQRRARIVACGNFQRGHPLEQEVQQPQSLSRFHLYASGLDSVALRVQLRMSAMESWEGAIVDVRKAFLYAPLKGNLSSDRVIVLTPPKVLVRTGLVSVEERWRVDKAVYGLEVSPSCWSRHRDKTMGQLTWTDQGVKIVLKALKSDPSLWRIVQVGQGPTEDVAALEVTVGLIGVYVDDLLITCLKRLLQGTIAALGSVWELSKPKHLSEGANFLGVDIKQENGRVFLTQHTYIHELLQRFCDVTGTAHVPFPLRDDTSETPAATSLLGQEEADTSSGAKLEDVRRAQGLVGALTWVATKSRIDLAYGVNKAAQLTARFPRKAIAVCEHMVRYLRTTQGFGLVYGPVPQHGVLATMDKGLLEAASDASFAPEGERSQSGVTLQWASGTIAWFTSRQSFITVSTAEAELYSMSEANLLLASISPLIEELAGVVRRVTYNDSIAAVSIVRQPSGPWRTRHLRLRASHIREQIESETLEVFHMTGTDMVADSLTKPLPRQRLDHLFRLLSFGDVNQLVACSTLICMLQPVSAQGRTRPDGQEGFWIWIVSAFLVGMVFAILVQRLPLLWVWVQGWFRRGSAPSEPVAAGSRELHVISYVDDVAVIGPPAEGLRSRGETVVTGLRDAPTYTPEEIEQIFDQWYGQNVEHYDPYDPELELSPSMRNNFGDETNDVESDERSIDFGEQHRSEPSALLVAPLASSFSRVSGSESSSSGINQPVVAFQPFSGTSRSSGQVLRVIPNTLTPENWEYWAERTLLGHIPNSRNRDEWELREDEGVLIRWHGKFRGPYFDPRVTVPPIPFEQFTGLRRTFCTFRDGHQSTYITGDFRTALNSFPPDGYQWRGRSEFLVYTCYNPAPYSPVPEPVLSQAAPPKSRPAKHPPVLPSSSSGSSTVSSSTTGAMQQTALPAVPNVGPKAPMVKSPPVKSPPPRRNSVEEVD